MPILGVPVQAIMGFLKIGLLIFTLFSFFAEGILNMIKSMIDSVRGK